MPSAPDIRILAAPADARVLDRVAEGVFDGPVDAALWAQFLAEPSHVLAVAVVDGTVAAMASGVRHLHPDKPPQLWINEVGTGDAHQRRGLARAVLEALLAHGRASGCTEAWVLTDADNTAARGLYTSLGAEESGGHVMATFRF